MKNERGYTLITVLLIITIFMIMFLSFTGLAFSSVKQNQVVEKSSKSVALAEMGISYYQIAVDNIYRSNQLKINEQIHQLVKNVPGKDNEYYTQQAVFLMENVLDQGLALEKSSMQINDNPDTAFSIQNKSILTEPNNIRIKLTVVGTDHGKNATLSSEMLINLNAVMVPGEIGGGSGSITPPVLPAFNAITKPVGFDVCQNPSTLSCQKILIEGAKSYTENNNGLTDKTIYSTGALTLSGNLNNMTKVNLHTDGAISIGKNMNNLSSTLFEAKGSAEFGGQLRADSTRVFIGGALSIIGQLELSNNSLLYVGGSAAISKHITINSNSKMCVKGSLSASQLNIYGKLIIIGSVSGKIKVGTPTYVSEQEFINQCGISTTPPPSSLSIDWADKIGNNVNYEY